MLYSDLIANIPKSGSTQLLAMLFGGNIYNLFGGSSSYHGPKETMLTLFGSLMVSSHVVLLFFWAIAFYFLIAGIINQSRNGSFLLKTWNGAWPWFRMIFGLTGVLPSMSVKGFVLIQSAVLSAALLASSAADITWQNVLSNAAKYGLTTHKILQPEVDQTKTDAYLNAAFKYSVCLANKIRYNNADKSLDISTIDPMQPELIPQGEIFASQCAGEKFLSYIKSVQAEQAPQVPDLSPVPGTDLISSDTLAKFHQYQQEQFRYLEDQTIYQYMQITVWQFYTTNMDAFSGDQIPQDLAEDWQGILDTFHRDLKDKIHSAILADKGIAADVFARQVGRYGWISAANYYKQLAGEQQIINSQISAGLKNSPNFVDFNQQTDLTNADSMTRFHVAKAETWIGKIGDLAKDGAQKYLLDPLGINFLKMGDDTDPFLAMTNFGQKLEGSAEVLMALRQSPRILSRIPLIGDWASKTVGSALNNGFMNFLLGFLIISGIILAVILPCLPWIFFLFAIISWMIYVAEMFIASPFWIVANAIPDSGTLLSNVAKKGLNNVMFIVLFPILAIGGLVASIGISWIGISMLNHFTYTAFKSMSALTAPFNIFGVVFIYVLLAWPIMVNSLSLIQSFPRTILNWLSLAQPGMNQFDNSHMQVKERLERGVQPDRMLQSGLAGAMAWEASRSLGVLESAKERGLRNRATQNDSE